MAVDNVRKEELLERLEIALLEDFVRLYEEGELSPTDRRTILTLLKDGGRSYDLDMFPRGFVESIKEKYPLPATPAPEDEDAI